MPAIKNILIFVVIAGIFAFIYITYFRPSPGGTDALVSSSGAPAVPDAAAVAAVESNALAQDFINLLLNVKNIKLNDAIFSDPAFISLDGSHSITLIPDGKEGRPNPFAPIGVDVGEIPGATQESESEEDILAEEEEDAAVEADVSNASGGAAATQTSGQNAGAGASGGAL